MSWGAARWDLIWPAIRDVLVTGTGLAVIISQVLSATPSDTLLVTGLALTAPSVVGHARALLAPAASLRDGPSSPSSPPPGSPPSGSSPAEAGSE